MPDIRRSTFATRATLFLRLNTVNAERSEIAWQEFHDRYDPVIAGLRTPGGGWRECDAVSALQGEG
jgi:hypothetical protein